MLTKKPTFNRFKMITATVFLCVTCATSTAYGERAITLKQAVLLSLQQHPELKQFTYSQAIAQGNITQAKTATALMINADVEQVMGTGDSSGIKSMQTSLGVAWLLEQSKINAQVKVADTQALAASLNQQTKMLDVAAKTASIFVTVLSQQAQLQLAKLDLSQAKKMHSEIKKRVKIGKTNAIDELRATASMAKKALVVEDLIHEIEASKAQLSAQWQNKSSFLLQGNLLTIPHVQHPEQVYKQLKTNPNLQLFANQQRVMQSQIELAKATANPAWQIRAGVKRNEAVDDISFSAGISIPFGKANRNQGKIAALQAKQQQNEAKASAWYQNASTQVLLLMHQIKHNGHVIDGLSNEVIPTLERANKKAEQAYKMGSYRYSDWYSIQQELLMAQQELIAAYSTIHLLNIELERLTGVSLTTYKAQL